jgi:hypothetical protein
VKYWQISLVIIAALFASLALAEDLKTTNGKEYKDAKVTRVEPDGVVITFRGGMVKIYFVELPKDVQRRFGYDSDKLEAQAAAARAAEAKRIEEQKEKEKNAEAGLKPLLEQFQVAEQRSAQAYQSAPKGTLSGQIFVATKGGENAKLGAVQVLLFARDATDVLLAGLRSFADAKIQRLQFDIEAAAAAAKQANAQTEQAKASDATIAAKEAINTAQKASDAAIGQFHDLLKKKDFYYSAAFYFRYLGFPVQTVETDAEGKFVLQVPQSGTFAIAAQASRTTGNDTEKYYWLQPISLEGQQQLTQNLSNNNLTSRTGSSSLIHTQD